MPVSDMLLSSSPHLFTQVSTRKIMLSVIIALVPATAYGIYLYGAPALFLVLSSIAASVAVEWLFRKITKQASHIDDLSAVVTGLLLALILPPSTPIWMVVLGDVMAIVVAKEFFGGLGQNPFNPALIGRAFLLMSFPAAITTWHKPFQGLVDATTTATPLNMVPELQKKEDKDSLLEGFAERSRDVFSEQYYSALEAERDEAFWYLDEAGGESSPDHPFPIPYSTALAQSATIPDLVETLQASRETQAFCAVLASRVGAASIEADK